MFSKSNKLSGPKETTKRKRLEGRPINSLEKTLSSVCILNVLKYTILFSC